MPDEGHFHKSLDAITVVALIRIDRRLSSPVVNMPCMILSECFSCVDLASETTRDLGVTLPIHAQASV